jgi:hypothetical protein
MGARDRSLSGFAATWILRYSSAALGARLKARALVVFNVTRNNVTRMCSRPLMIRGLTKCSALNDVKTAVRSIEAAQKLKRHCVTFIGHFLHPLVVFLDAFVQRFD